MRAIRAALTWGAAIGHDCTELAGTKIFGLALHVKTVEEEAQRSIGMAPKLFTAETEVIPGDRPEFGPAQRLGGFCTATSGFSVFCSAMKNRP
jgi:hypothetical protein